MAKEPMAVETLEEARRFWELRGDATDAHYASILLHLALAHESAGQLDRSLLVGLRAAKLCHEKPHLFNTTSHLDILTGIGRTYHKKGEYHKALPFLEGANDLSNARDLKDTERHASILSLWGSCLAAKGNSDQATQILETAKTLWDNLGMRRNAGYARLLADLGRLMSDSGLHERALGYLTLAAELKSALADEGADVSLLDPRGEDEAILALLRRTWAKRAQQKEVGARQLQRLLTEHEISQ